MPKQYTRIYEALKAYGFSAPKAREIVIDATRGDGRILAGKQLLHAHLAISVAFKNRHGNAPGYFGTTFDRNGREVRVFIPAGDSK